MSPSEKFGQAAIQARKYFIMGLVNSPRNAWDKATNEIFEKWYYREKPCPRSAFLGLCEEGLVKDIPRGNYSNATKNKEYAIKAVTMLKDSPSWRNNNKRSLWKEIVKKKPISYDYQLDVVFALWDNKLIT